jgi:erythromycin esterase
MESRGHVAARLGIVALSAISFACAGSDKDDGPGNAPTQPQGGSGQIAGVPGPWFGGSSIQPAEYEVGRDVQLVHGGFTSVYVRSLGTSITPATFGTVTQVIRADNYRGHRVRYSGYLRVADVTGEGFGLWLRTDAAVGTRSFDNMAGRRRTGNQEWAYAEIVVDVPEHTIGMSFGALMSGPGVGWVDDLRLEVVGNDVPLTVPATTAAGDSATLVSHYEPLSTEPLNLDFEGITLPESQATTVDWMRNNSVAFTTDDPSFSDGDLEPLRAMIGNARLVAVGEATHGTREFFRMKHRLFQYLVRQRAFDQFSIEASLPEALAVDRFVQTGVGDPAALVRGMRFWTWSTEEVIDLVRWMRAWNAAGGQPQLRFTGFDMQFPDVAMDSVVAFTSGLSESLGDSVRSSYDCLYVLKHPVSRLVSQPNYQRLDNGAQEACRTAIQGVEARFTQRHGEWAAATTPERADLMARLARLVTQWEHYARDAATRTRDIYMAENIAWWRSRGPGSAGMMVWAHNAHISRRLPWMGSDLKRAFGADYVTIAQTFSAGSFNAVFQNSVGAIGALTTHVATGSTSASVEALLDATGRDRAIFDARSMKVSGTPGFALRNRLTMRLIGSTFNPAAALEQYQAPMILPDDFDIIIWFRNASASRLSLSSTIGSNSIAVYEQE